MCGEKMRGWRWPFLALLQTGVALYLWELPRAKLWICIAVTINAVLGWVIAVYTALSNDERP